MNYYIQGNAANADKIRAAFERLGYDVNNWRFTIGVYYTLNGRIVNTHIGSNEYELILNSFDYKELELPVEPKFKVGDWITCVDDDGDTSTEMIEDFWGDKVRLIDCDGVFTLYPKSELKQYHLWSIQDAKDGDVLCTYECGEPKIVFIYKNGTDVFMYYCFYNIMYPRFDANNKPGCLAPKREDVKPATKEQRELLFTKMKEAGYQWDAEKKELRKIQLHYDIANFQPFDKVLVRDNDKYIWSVELFSFYRNKHNYPFRCVGNAYSQCIPFNDDTKHLLGTTDMCDEMYINW